VSSGTDEQSNNDDGSNRPWRRMACSVSQTLRCTTLCVGPKGPKMRGLSNHNEHSSSHQRGPLVRLFDKLIEVGRGKGRLFASRMGRPLVVRGDLCLQR